MGRKFKILLLILKKLPESHDSQQGSMAPPSAFSSDQVIDSQMSLDPQFLVPTDNTVSSDPTQTTFVSNKYNDISLKLPSTEDNSDSLMKTEEFLEFVDELPQEPSPLSDKEGTSNQNDTVPSVKLKKVFILPKLITLLRMLTAHLIAKTFLLLKCLKIMELSL